MEAQKDIGVIVGRFQVHELHEAHRDIIETVMKNHRRVVIFLGVSPALISKHNPLDFVTRKEMILSSYPNLTVLSIPDHPSDKEWSKELDRRIREACPVGSVMLYGSRDCFIKSYFGSFETKELEQKVYVSGTEVRKEVSREIKASPDFRAGVIFAAYNQYAKVYPTVDVAVFNDGKLLLAKKPSVDNYRFIGGFADPTDNSFEEAAKREVMEESNIEIGDIEYVGSHRVDDWRYRSEEDKIMTTLFMAKYVHGRINPQDDISELRWFEWDEVSEDIFVSEHKPLFNLLKQKVTTKTLSI
jgi:bifunctional NMN adenylyltransferase/nudix hydrolase